MELLFLSLVSVTHNLHGCQLWIPFLNTRSLSVIRSFDRSNLFYIIIMGDTFETLPVLDTNSAQGLQINIVALQLSGISVGGPGCVNIETILK